MIGLAFRDEIQHDEGFLFDELSLFVIINHVSSEGQGFIEEGLIILGPNSLFGRYADFIIERFPLYEVLAWKFNLD